MKTVTATELRTNIYQLIDEVLETRLPLEVTKNGQKLKLVPPERANKLAALEPHPDPVIGDPDDLVNMSWEDEINLDIP